MLCARCILTIREVTGARISPSVLGRSEDVFAELDPTRLRLTLDELATLEDRNYVRNACFYNARCD